MNASYSLVTIGLPKAVSTVYERTGVREIVNSSVVLRETSLSASAANTIAGLKSFRNLEQNWDSYGALRTAESAVRNAIRFVCDLDRAGLSAYFVAPGPNGEIVVELKSGALSLEIYFSEDGSCEHIEFNGTEYARASDARPDIDSLRKRFR